MAPREGSSIAPQGGVVDERLNVHGVKGLKVCDLSICPDNVGCNTFSVSDQNLDFQKIRSDFCLRLDCSSNWREVRCSDCRRPGILWRRLGYGCSQLSRPWRNRQSRTPVKTMIIECLAKLLDNFHSSYFSSTE